ncbi:MAG: permease [Gammaproteobacteria bacterium]|nr:permease [Gammaproteobacteria bacterium]
MTELALKIRRLGTDALGIDRVLLVLVTLFGVIALLTPDALVEALVFVAGSLLWIAPFLLLSVAVAAYASASGADKLIALAFQGRPLRMVAVAALFGALSPFCSCGVIPIIASLLAAGVPLAPVMAFWVASPLMDPEMFILSSAALGVPFTVAKTLAAVGIGLLAGYATHLLGAAGLLASPLRAAPADSCATGCNSGCGPANEPRVVWRFWSDDERRRKFRRSALETGWFLGKWLTLAFAIESQMVEYVPADLIVTHLGTTQWWTLPAAVLAGVPAYLNGYAAIPLMARLIEMGMAPGAALAFLLAGGITSIPAAIAVWVLVRARVFAWYLVLAASGSLLAGLIYQAVA